ncbi:MAG: YcbK family protein [Candidatus Aminicenantales bacterium]
MDISKLMTPPPDIPGRRRFLRLGAAALALPILSRFPAFAEPIPLPANRDLSLYNTHTGESAAVEYCRSGCLVSPSLEKINYVLRDHRTGEMKAIDIRLLDLLNMLSRKTAADRPFYVISGYRSPQTNAFLRAHSRGVAEHSLHLVGKAIDIRLPGLKLRDLYRAAVSLRGGGVGIYPESDFVHVDIGRVRTW